MTARVYGKVNGREIELEYDQTRDRWQVPVPGDQDGEYVIEIYAEDEAGNRDFKCLILFEVSGKQVRCKIIPHRYIVEKATMTDPDIESRTNNFTVVTKNNMNGGKKSEYQG